MQVPVLGAELISRTGEMSLADRHQSTFARIAASEYHLESFAARRSPGIQPQRQGYRKAHLFTEIAELPGELEMARNDVEMCFRRGKLTTLAHGIICALRESGEVNFCIIDGSTCPQKSEASGRGFLCGPRASHELPDILKISTRHEPIRDLIRTFDSQLCNEV